MQEYKERQPSVMLYSRRQARYKEAEDVVQSERLQHSCCSTGPLRQAWCVRNVHSQRMRHQRTITIKALFQTWWWKEDEDVISNVMCLNRFFLKKRWSVVSVLCFFFGSEIVMITVMIINVYIRL